MTKSLTFKELEAALHAFGYTQRHKGKHVIFEHPAGTAMIVLPPMNPNAGISSLHHKIVERAIRDDGIVDWDDVGFYMEHGKRKENTIKKGDHLVWRVPDTGKEIKVLAAAGEQDGMVIIKQNGTFSPCKVDQLRKDGSVIRGTR